MLVNNTIVSRIIIGLFLIMLTCWLPASGAENVPVTPVTTPFITIDPIGNHTVGDVFFINGTTNLPVTEKLELEMEAAGRIPTVLHGYSVHHSIYIANILISPTLYETNRWSVNVTDRVKEEGFPTGEYSVYIHSFKDHWYNSSKCNILFTDNASVFTLISSNNIETPIVLQTQTQITFPDKPISRVLTLEPTTQVTPLDLAVSISVLGTMLVLRYKYGKR
jgi:hypothetical protein